MKRLRTLLTILLYLSLSMTLMAQRPRYGKLSPMLRQLVMKQTERQLLADGHPLLQAPAANRHAAEVCAFIRIEDGAEDVLRRHHCRPITHYGPLYIAMIPLSSLPALTLEKAVSRIEAQPSCQLHNDSVVQQINALAVHEGSGDLPQAFTGRGVVMGVMDIGFDLTHPTFYSRDTTEYRIKAFWDQLSQDTVGSVFPVGRDFTTREELLTVAHARDGLDQTHGTHTLGTAAGSGYDSPYRGMAPESDICIVANAVTDDLVYIDSADVYKYTFATDALGFKYIFDYADSVGKPCVISFSEGSVEDFWGYDQLYYEMLDSLVGPGHIIVASAGNQGRTKSWFRKPAGQSSIGTFIRANKSSMTVTLKSANDFTLRFINYYDERDTLLIKTRDVLAQEDSLLTMGSRHDNQITVLQVVAYPSCYNPAETCYDVNIVTTNSVGSSPKMSMEVLGTLADVEVYRANGYFEANPLNPALNAGDYTHNIHSPSSSPSVICVGATQYRTGVTNYQGNWRSAFSERDGERNSYSSVGPTFDGRIKPDVMAPGINVISSYSSYYLENHPTASDIAWDVAHFDFEGRTYAWNCNSGTSMAAPAVGGAIALWLQANPRLTPQDVLDVISRTSHQHDPLLASPNNEYGYGEIDVYHGLLDILRLTSVRSMSTHQAKARVRISRHGMLTVAFGAPLSRSARLHVYDLQGRRLFSHDLPAGMQHWQTALGTTLRGVYAVQLDTGDDSAGSLLVRAE